MPSSLCLPSFSLFSSCLVTTKPADGSLPPVLAASNLFEEITAILNSLEFQNRWNKSRVNEKAEQWRPGGGTDCKGVPGNFLTDGSLLYLDGGGSWSFDCASNMGAFYCFKLYSKRNLYLSREEDQYPPGPPTGCFLLPPHHTGPASPGFSWLQDSRCPSPHWEQYPHGPFWPGSSFSPCCVDVRTIRSARLTPACPSSCGWSLRSFRGQFLAPLALVPLPAHLLWSTEHFCE